MRIKYFIIILSVVLLIGCDMGTSISIHETEHGYTLSRGLPLVIELQTHLSSNSNVRGDIVEAHLKRSIVWGEKIILPQNAKIEGVVEQTTRYEKFGDQASLVLVFNYLVLSHNKRIPIVSCLDTSLGMNAIKIKGKAEKDAKMILKSSLGGAFIGGMGPQGTGAKVAGAGAAFGTVAVLLSDMQEINLPVGTEMTIVLSEELYIPKK